MSVGRTIRRLAGPAEPWLSDFYRGLFFSIDDFTAHLSDIRPPKQVVEIGCGEGALLSALSDKWPKARFDGLDLIPGIGRLFKGDATRVKFHLCSAQELSQRQQARADLVVICDVMHHVPAAQHADILSAAERLVHPGGRIVIKEWLCMPSLAYWAGYGSDRFITGDDVQYRTRDEWLESIASTLPNWIVECEWTLRPWSCNYALCLKRNADVHA